MGGGVKRINRNLTFHKYLSEARCKMVKRYNQWTEEEKNSFIKQQEKDFEIMKKMLSFIF